MSPVDHKELHQGWRERKRETDRQTETQRETDRETDRQKQTESSVATVGPSFLLYVSATVAYSIVRSHI